MQVCCSTLWKQVHGCRPAIMGCLLFVPDVDIAGSHSGLSGCRGVKLGGLQVAVGDIVALTSDDEDDSDVQLALLQALWQTASKAKMMQVSHGYSGSTSTRLLLLIHLSSKFSKSQQCTHLSEWDLPNSAYRLCMLCGWRLASSAGASAGEGRRHSARRCSQRRGALRHRDAADQVLAPSTFLS